MKKGFLVVLSITVFVSLYSLYLTHGESIPGPRISSLFLENIEALAADEDGTDDGESGEGVIQCLGDGSLDCPVTHQRVKYVVSGYSFGKI